MIDLKKAQQLILDATPVLGRESVPILDALNRVLVEDITAVQDLPAADISAVDGYAVCHGSLTGASPSHPASLRIIGEAPAGKPCRSTVGTGEAVRIMTGGLLPKGADTIVKIEHTTESGNTVTCNTDPGTGAGIRFKGDSLKKGDVVLHAGDTVHSLEIGSLACLRRAYVTVHRKPLVAIVSTGDEISDFHEPPALDKAMCSNLYALAAQVLETHATPLCLGTVPDDLEAQKNVLSEAMRADVIITSGGTSRGKYDLIHKAFASLGLETRFSSIFVKPGKPTIFGTIGKTLVFGLPGNPSATMLSFEQFIRPALLRMMGHLNGSDASPAKSNGNSRNDPFAQIDSFNRALGGNKAHLRPSQVPLGNIRTGNGRPLGRQTPCHDIQTDQLKVAAH
ncbi:gephyrin-like molybdotransferase Glp [Desulfosarcina ovata]|uniref:Molybdopterin molybdenumtransferase n=1 Tax=Desulfosarcina ovata subsp. ovata TaxID=2752305 RepID=A0A5K8AJW7_9BACT|nr:gephyrin-like molybdotransferase Glp [Desulfosarcina ovata]BBO92971.1 molybdopterin molybdenumtransferase MoeA [Desulfosarcina ovata subsp. ovata]